MSGETQLQTLIEHADRCVVDGSARSAGRRAVHVENGDVRIAQYIAGLRIRRHETTSTLDSFLYEPVLCLILKGQKRVTIGGQPFTLDSGDCLLVSHDLPVRSEISKAPYLALVFDVNVSTIRKLYDEISDSLFEITPARAAIKYRADHQLINALDRYVALIDAPADAQVLGPLVSTEIHYRLLAAPFGGMLRSLVRRDSNASAVARAIGHIRGNIRSPIAIPELARRVGMSTSAFHKHFKVITSTTPLQYQKELRLLEARHLLRSSGASVTSAAYDVGYESANQFSREYARKFGVPPSRDVERAR